MSRSITLSITMSAVALTLLTPGCPPSAVDTIPGGDTGADGDTTTLTSDESGAVDTLLGSLESLTSAVGAAQNAANAEDDQQTALDNAETDGGVTDESGENTDGDGIGQGGDGCPTFDVSLATGSGETLAFNATVDFGDGCDLLGSDDYSCAGAAGASLAGGVLTFTFDDLTCNDNSISGEALVSASFTDPVAELTGEFDLALASAAQQVSTSGEGITQFNRTTFVTSIPTFEGVLSDGQDTYSATASDIEVSFSEYGNFVPFAGQATLSSDNIRALTVVFDSNSPLTGEVQVSFDGTTFFAYNLFE